MYRSLLALLFAAVLLLSGCAAGRQTVPKEKSGQETNMDGAAFDRSDEEITYMDTTENVIYLAGGCFWGMEQQKPPPHSFQRIESPRPTKRIWKLLKLADRLPGERGKTLSHSPIRRSSPRRTPRSSIRS